MSSRRTYTREFKIEAAQLSYNSDKSVSEIAESLGVLFGYFETRPCSKRSCPEHRFW